MGRAEVRIADRPRRGTILTAPARIEQLGDLWAGTLDAKHDLKALLDSV